MDVVELVKYRGTKPILETLQAFPERQFTISELAKTAKVPFSSVWRLVKKWEPAGIIETGRVGNSITVRFKKSSYTSRIAKLLELNASPQKHTVEQLAGMLRKTTAVKQVFLFGSVARHEEKIDSDIDLAILAETGFDADALAFKVYEKYGTKIIPLVFKTEKELSAFLKDKDKVKIL